MLKCYKVHEQKAADLATLGPFQQLETVLLLFLIGNIVGRKKVSCGFGELDLCTISRLWLSHSENLISRSNTNLYVPSTIVVSKLGHVPWDILVNNRAKRGSKIL